MQASLLDKKKQENFQFFHNEKQKMLKIEVALGVAIGIIAAFFLAGLLLAFLCSRRKIFQNVFKKFRKSSRVDVIASVSDLPSSTHPTSIVLFQASACFTPVFYSAKA